MELIVSRICVIVVTVSTKKRGLVTSVSKRVSLQIRRFGGGITALAATVDLVSNFHVAEKLNQ